MKWDDDSKIGLKCCHGSKYGDDDSSVRMPVARHSACVAGLFQDEFLDEGGGAVVGGEKVIRREEGVHLLH